MIPNCILVIEDDYDRVFMESLFHQYEKLMYRTINQIVTDPWAVDDIMQTTLEKLIEKLQRLQEFDRDHLVNYIISSCKNTAYNELRRQTRHSTVLFDEFWDSADDENNRHTMDANLIHQEEMKYLSEIWPKLDKRSQYVLEAKYILNKSMSEIAEDLSIQPESARMALTRARKNGYKLIKKLSKIN